MTYFCRLINKKTRALLAANCVLKISCVSSEFTDFVYRYLYKRVFCLLIICEKRRLGTVKVHPQWLSRRLTSQPTHQPANKSNYSRRHIHNISVFTTEPQHIHSKAFAIRSSPSSSSHRWCLVLSCRCFVVVISFQMCSIYTLINFVFLPKILIFFHHRYLFAHHFFFFFTKSWKMKKRKSGEEKKSWKTKEEIFGWLRNVHLRWQKAAYNLFWQSYSQERFFY